MKNLVLSYSLKQLSKLCLYPDVPSLKFKTCGILVCCFYISSWTLNVSGVFINFNGLDSIQQAMVSLPSAHQLLFKTIFMYFTKDKLLNVIRNIHNLQFLNPCRKPSVLWDKINNADTSFNAYFKIYKRIILITSYIFVFKPLLSFKRNFSIGWYTPCNINDNYCYATWYIWESIYILFAQYTLASMDGLFFSVIFTLHIEIMKLKDRFESLHLRRNTGVDKETCKELSNCVDCHNAILDTLHRVNSIFEYQLLNQFVTSIVTICFGIYYLNATYPPHLELIPYLLVYHNQLFMYCFAGEMIQRQISSIGLAVFNCQWYYSNNKMLCKSLQFIIHRSQKQFRMNIGHIWTLDMKTFIKVLRTSLSIHTFLQTINK